MVQLYLFWVFSRLASWLWRKTTVASCVVVSAFVLVPVLHSPFQWDVKLTTDMGTPVSALVGTCPSWDRSIMLRSHEAFLPPDALAMHKFGHRQASATMHQWFGEWSAMYASNRHASPRHRDIEKNFNACIEIFSQWLDAKYHRRYIAEQRRTVGEHSAMYTKVKNVPDTSATHRRHIGDARVNIGDAYSMW